MTEKEPHQEQETEDTETQDKIEKYKEMIGDSKAIFVLSASARGKEIKGKKNYRPDSYSDLDNHGNMGGGHARVIAAAEIAQYFPEVKIVTDSYDYEDEPTLAETYAEELKRLGVPAEQVELEEKSTNTVTELFELVKMAKTHNWESVAILTGESHTERTRAMVNHLKELAGTLNAGREFLEAWEYFENGKNLQFHFVTAEEILPLRDSRYKKIIDEVRNSEAYKKTEEAGKRGIKQIEDGTYGRLKV